jgi:hypothetical protein
MTQRWAEKKPNYWRHNSAREQVNASSPIGINQQLKVHLGP